MEMKAISIQQPWAHYIVTGHKPVENRSWPTRHRGPILIHASKTFDYQGYEWIITNRNKLNVSYPFFMPSPVHFKTGGIIGKANLVRMCKKHDSPWFFGSWGWVFEDPEEMKFMPIKGQLGIFTVNYDVGG